MSLSVLEAALADAVALPTPRLRSVRPDESAHPAARPGVYRLPEHVLAGLQPAAAAAEAPLVGYLVLVPAGQPIAQPQPQLQLQPQPQPQVTVFAPAPATAPVTMSPAALPAHGLAVDEERRVAYLDGRALQLTYLEFELLAHLTAHPHRVHTRDRLVEAVWGYGHVGDGRTVDVHVARLRRKLGPDYRDRIVTVRRVGYKYAPPAAR